MSRLIGLEGQLGTGNEQASSTPVLVSNITNVTDYSVGQATVVAITNGQLWGWEWKRLERCHHAGAIGVDNGVYVWGGQTYDALTAGSSSGRTATPALLAE